MMSAESPMGIGELCQAESACSEAVGRDGDAADGTNDDRVILRHVHRLALQEPKEEGVGAAAATGGSYPQWMHRTLSGCNNFAQSARRAPVSTRKISAPMSMPSTGAVT